MIKERCIREWNEFVPWKDMLMVEQDLIICRALVSIFRDMPGKRCRDSAELVQG